MVPGSALLATQGRGPAARLAPKPISPRSRSVAALLPKLSLPADRARFSRTSKPAEASCCRSRRRPLGAQPRFPAHAAAPNRALSGAGGPFPGWDDSLSESKAGPSTGGPGGGQRLAPRAKGPPGLGAGRRVSLRRFRSAAANEGERAADSNTSKEALPSVPFFNREDAVAELKWTLLDQPTSVTLLLGPKNCGKTALLRRAEGELQAMRQRGAGQAAPPLLHIDFRVCGVSSSARLSTALQKAAIRAGWWDKISEALARLGSGKLSVKAAGAAGSLEAEVQLPSITPSLGDVLDALMAYFYECKAAGIVPVMVLDEANKLMAWADKADVQELFDFFVVVTKQDNLAHVVLATSDSFFFMSWLGKQGVYLLDIKVLGDLPEAEAKLFFFGDGGRWPGVVAESARLPPLEEGTWAEVYAVCGGNMGLLKEVAARARRQGSWEAALQALEDVGAENVRNGFRAAALPARATPPAWTAAQYKAALGRIARNPHHAVPQSELEQALDTEQKLGVAALASLVEYNLLAVRPFSPWAGDLPREAHGTKRERVVTMPSPARLREVLKMEQRGELEEAQGEGEGAGGEAEPASGGAGR